MQPDHRARGLGEALQGRLEIHPEMVIVLPFAGDVVVELIRIPALVSADPHESLAGRDGADPAPETSLFPIASDAPADFEEGILENVFGILGSPADPAG